MLKSQSLLQSINRMLLVRLTAALVILCVAAVSSSFALCVSACVEPAAAMPAHACHDAADESSLTSAAASACAHEPELGPSGEAMHDVRFSLAAHAPAATTAFLTLALAPHSLRRLPTPSFSVLSPPLVLRV